jgi:hypothetical protein
LLTACPPTLNQLKETKAHYGREDYEWIAEQTISCRPSDQGCNQLYLMKGDACYRLAKEGNLPEVHFACAADHLDRGIRYTSNWQIEGLDLNRALTYVNLCESLRELQDMSKGTQAEQMTRRLLETAQAFRAAEENHPAAIYFVNSARYTLLRPELLRPTDLADLCDQLTAILRSLESAEPNARGTRYRPNYERLMGDVAGAMQAVGCP